MSKNIRDTFDTINNNSDLFRKILELNQEMSRIQIELSRNTQDISRIDTTQKLEDCLVDEKLANVIDYIEDNNDDDDDNYD